MVVAVVGIYDDAMINGHEPTFTVSPIWPSPCEYARSRAGEIFDRGYNLGFSHGQRYGLWTGIILAISIYTVVGVVISLARYWTS